MKLELDFKTKETISNIHREMQSALSITNVLIDCCHTAEFAEHEDIRRTLLIMYEKLEKAVESFEAAIDFL